MELEGKNGDNFIDIVDGKNAHIINH